MSGIWLKLCLPGHSGWTGIWNKVSRPSPHTQSSSTRKRRWAIRTLRLDPSMTSPKVRLPTCSSGFLIFSRRSGRSCSPQWSLGSVSIQTPAKWSPYGLFRQFANSTRSRNDSRKILFSLIRLRRRSEQKRHQISTRNGGIICPRNWQRWRQRLQISSQNIGSHSVSRRGSGWIARISG